MEVYPGEDLARPGRPGRDPGASECVYRRSAASGAGCPEVAACAAGPAARRPAMQPLMRNLTTSTSSGAREERPGSGSATWRRRGIAVPPGGHVREWIRRSRLPHSGNRVNAEVLGLQQPGVPVPIAQQVYDRGIAKAGVRS